MNIWEKLQSDFCKNLTEFYQISHKKLPYLTASVHSLWHVCSLKSDLLPFFMCFYHMYIAPGRGRQPTGDKNFDDNRKAFSPCPWVANFKMISSKSDFIHIFNDFVCVYSPRVRTENPLGTNF